MAFDALFDEPIDDSRIAADAAIAVAKLAGGAAGEILLSDDDGVPVWGPLTLEAGIVSDEHVAADAAIAVSKLAGGAVGQLLQSNGSGVPVWGALPAGSVANANVAADAAVAVSKLAGGSVGQMLVSNESGVPVWGALPASAVSNTNVATGAAIDVAKFAPGVAGQVLFTNGSVAPQWLTVSGGLTFDSTGLATVTAMRSASFLSYGSASADAVRFTAAPTGSTTWTVQSGVTAFTLTQSSTSSASGAAWSFAAQSTTRTDAAGVGGNVTISSGGATGSHAFANTSGSILCNIGNAANGASSTFGTFQVQRNGTTAVTITPHPTGASTFRLSSTVTSFGLDQNSTTSANGATHTYSAQSTSRTDASGTGGSIQFLSGAATGTHGFTNASGNIIFSISNAANGGVNTFGTIQFQRTGTAAITITPHPTGGSVLRLASTVTAWNAEQGSTSSANGAIHTYAAQSTSLDGGVGGGMDILGGHGTGAATGTGGDIRLIPGTGTTAGGNVNITGGNSTSGTTGKVNLQSASTTLASFGGAGFERVSTSIALTSGTTTLTQAQHRFPLLRFTGTLSGNCTAVLPATTGGDWIIDTTAIVFGGFTITLRANGNDWGTVIAAGGVHHVVYGGTGRLYGAALAA